MNIYIIYIEREKERKGREKRIRQTEREERGTCTKREGWAKRGINEERGERDDKSDEIVEKMT